MATLPPFDFCGHDDAPGGGFPQADAGPPPSSHAKMREREAGLAVGVATTSARSAGTTGRRSTRWRIWRSSSDALVPWPRGLRHTREALSASLPATNAKRLRKGAKRRSNPFFPLRLDGLLRFARNDGESNAKRCVSNDAAIRLKRCRSAWNYRALRSHQPSLNKHSEFSSSSIGTFASPRCYIFT